MKQNKEHGYLFIDVSLVSDIILLEFKEVRCQ